MIIAFSEVGRKRMKPEKKFVSFIYFKQTKISNKSEKMLSFAANPGSWVMRLFKTLLLIFLH